MAGRGRRILRAALDLAIRVREPFPVWAPGGPAAATRQVRAQLEAGEPIGDVLREAGLRVLAVARNIDAALGLHADGVGHVTGQKRASEVGEGLPVFLALENVNDLPRPNEAAHVGGEDPALAALHRSHSLGGCVEGSPA